MNQVTLPSRYRIRNRTWWSEVKQAVKEAQHDESLRVVGEEIFCFFETWISERWKNPRVLTLHLASLSIIHQGKYHCAVYECLGADSVM